MTSARKLILAVLLGLLALPLLAGPAAASKGQVAVMEDDRQLLYLDAGSRARALDDMRALGVDAVRTQISWRQVNPQPGQYDWGAYDALVDGARARGLKVFATITGAGPAWASQCRVKSGPCKPSPRAFQTFVTEVGRHFAGRVSTWTLWNEPNIDSRIKPQYAVAKGRRYIYAARRYRDLYRAGYRGLAASGHARDRILLGDLSATGSRRAVAPLSFYRDLFCIDSKGRALRGTAAAIRGCRGFRRLPASGVAHHPYAPAAACSPKCKGAPRDITIAGLSRLGKVLDQAVRRGRLSRGARTRIWMTEFSFQGRPGGSVTPTEQAKYLNWSEWIAFRNPRVRSFAQYELVDDSSVSGIFATTGLRYASWAPKPAYAAWRMPLFVVRASRTAVKVFGGVRPGGAHTVSVQARKGSRWRQVTKVRTNRAGYLYVRLKYRKTWRLVSGGLVSRVSGVR